MTVWLQRFALACLLALAPLGLLACVDRIPDQDRDGVSEADGDCDDRDPDRFPGAPELCDSVDQDCNGVVDDLDADGDGSSGCAGDCNDASVDVAPFNEEVCDGVDNDCDEQVDEGFDQDGDGHASCLGDCDDDDPTRHEGVPEACDGIDNDCDELVDEDFDQDGDGYRTCDADPDCNDTNASQYPGATEQCDGADWNCDGVPGTADQDMDGYAACQGDCNDGNSAIGPANAEVCDSFDNNCNGQVDEGFDADNDGATSCAGDCDDNNPNVGPTIAEFCDGLDNDCDGQPDENFDQDGDGFSTCAQPVADCDDDDFRVRPDADEECDNVDNNCDGNRDEEHDVDGDGWAVCDGEAIFDCDEANPNVNPGAAESCNDVDDDCDGFVDEDFDADNDGFSVCQDDCDDTDGSINPDTPEVCDGVDDNCDGVPDETFDVDGDTATSCGPDGIPGNADDDCDDNDPNVFPGALELACDGKDTDCNGFILPAEVDADGDSVPPCGNDCDDNDPLRFPGNPEVCNARDSDCLDGVDDGFDVDGDGVTTCGPDGVAGNADDDCDDSDPGNAPIFAEVCDLNDDDCDGVVDDGFDVDGDTVYTCGPDGIVGTADDDCDDNDDTTYPGAEQTCTAADNDCDGLAGNLDDDFDGSFLCEDCDDDNPDIYPGAGFIDCDGSDWNCDGVPETEVRVGYLPGQNPSWANLPALQDLVNESAGWGGCTLTFTDIPAPITEATLLAEGIHVAMVSSPGEAGPTVAGLYDEDARLELMAWLSGEGRGVVITGTLGSDASLPYQDRYELATLAGVTLSSSDVATARSPVVNRQTTTLWTGITGFSFTASASTTADGILSSCSGAEVTGTVGNGTQGNPRFIIAYEANPSVPCLAGNPMDHRGVWLPLQPEDGGNGNDRRLLYNAIDWIKSGP